MATPTLRHPQKRPALPASAVRCGVDSHETIHIRLKELFAVSAVDRRLRECHAGRAPRPACQGTRYALPMKSVLPMLVPAARRMSYAVVQWKNMFGNTKCSR